MKSIIYSVAMTICLLFASCAAPIKNAITESIKVYGNCGMCESTIEKAGNVSKIASVQWDKSSKMATFIYDTTQTNRDEILKRIALAGYDSDQYLAPGDAYASLETCCQYNRSAKIAVKPEAKMENVANMSGMGDVIHQHDMHDGHDGASMDENKTATTVIVKQAEGTDVHTGHSAPVKTTVVKAEETKSAVNKPASTSSSKEVVKTTPAPAKPKVESKKAHSEMMPVYEKYFELKDALVKTDATAAAAKANEFLTALKAIKMNAMPMEEHMAFMKVLKDLNADAKLIAGTKDVDKQRARFSSLSSNIYTIFKTSKLDAPVYLQHCPMAFDGKGADWLSKENNIKNPYYGSMMLSCGKVTEVIK